MLTNFWGITFLHLFRIFESLNSNTLDVCSKTNCVYLIRSLQFSYNHFVLLLCLFNMREHQFGIPTLTISPLESTIQIFLIASSLGVPSFSMAIVIKSAIPMAAFKLTKGFINFVTS